MVPGSSLPVGTPIGTGGSYGGVTKAAKDAFDADLAERLTASETWLAANAKADAVQTLASGLQYRVLKTGTATGAASAGATKAKLHFTASSADGVVFNSSFQRGAPVELNISDMISGWQEAVSRMNPGDEWIIYLHPSLAYGADGYLASVPPNAVTVFRIALIDKF